MRVEGWKELGQGEEKIIRSPDMKGRTGSARAKTHGEVPCAPSRRSAQDRCIQMDIQDMGAGGEGTEAEL